MLGACRWHRLSKAEQLMLSANVKNILLVSGDEDIIVSPHCARRLQETMQCGSIVFEGCGHSPHNQRVRSDRLP